ncbi:GrpB family protein [Macrococcus equipercicus]|uniref:GrpB family protein n=1 Tax=Macrococcus equipercicus TaxID=69967 RepID=A0ABQ6RB95_9STAP|nr:GrpB family protein [Macrococcus equipercicus]KAA1042439.1 GrpB family protein [Macrococcus equipercicus]
MLKQRSSLTLNNDAAAYALRYREIENLLFNLLDTPVTAVHHIGSTALQDAMTSAVIDVLVIVPNLHAMTTLDEKRLNNSGFYRLHHPYRKKCVFTQFTDLKTLNEQCRLHVIEADSDKAARYLAAQQALAAEPELLNAFNTFKSGLNALSKQDYEEKKSIWFASLIANQ